jgi:antitoxin component of MazEF toxin-antitoxin module
MDYAAKILKIGNSFAVTIPMQYIKDGSINPALPVKISIESNKENTEAENGN